MAGIHLRRTVSFAKTKGVTGRRVRAKKCKQEKKKAVDTISLIRQSTPTSESKHVATTWDQVMRTAGGVHDSAI
jgi:hypothetical protein